MRTYITVSSSLKDQAQGLLGQFGNNIFSVPLSVSGQEPATHYGCCWIMSDVERTRVEQLLNGLDFSFGEDFNGFTQIININK